MPALRVRFSRGAVTPRAFALNSRDMKTRFYWRSCAVVLLLSSFAYAQEKAIILRAARMFDGHEMRTPGLVVVNGSRILGVGPGAPTPAGAQVIDFGDATLAPGFFDAHTHLSMMYNADYRQNELDELQRSIPERTLRATENLKKTLMVGVTTARDVGSSE